MYLKDQNFQKHCLTKGGGPSPIIFKKKIFGKIRSIFHTEKLLWKSDFWDETVSKVIYSKYSKHWPYTPSHTWGARNSTGRAFHIFEFSWIVKNASLCTGSCSSWGLDVLGRCTSIQIHTTPKTLLAGLWKSRKGQL